MGQDAGVLASFLSYLGDVCWELQKDAWGSASFLRGCLHLFAGIFLRVILGCVFGVIWDVFLGSFLDQLLSNLYDDIANFYEK